MSKLATRNGAARGLRAAALTLGLLAAATGASAASRRAGRAPSAGASRAEAVAVFFNRTPEEIDGLRLRGYGFGEIVKVLVVAEMSRRPIAELVERNRKGYGWGTISRELGLHPAVVKRRVDMARDALGIRVHPAGPPAQKP